MYQIYFYRDSNGREPVLDYVKYLDDDIWELRPLRDRILFAGWVNNSYVLLHCFVKKTQKTPAREIEKARRELKRLKDGSV